MEKNLRSKNSSASKEIEPDIAGFMVKIQEQLTALAQKIDAWTGQIPAVSSEGRAHPGSIQQESRPPKHFQQPLPSQPFQHPQPPQGPVEVKQVHSRRERILHKAVCADCHKDCEIPFKPSGERPVYCKPCFSKRKVNSSSQANAGPSQPATLVASAPVAVDRHVVVTKKGVGKVTVSEIVRPSTRAFPSKDKSHKPAQRAKK